MSRIFLLLIPLLFFFTGCSKNVHPPKPPVPESAEIADLKKFPQNLELFASEYGTHKRLLSSSRQGELAHSFQDIFFGPWHMGKTSLSRRDAGELLGRARGFKENELHWTQEDMDRLKLNANLAAFPSRSLHAITVRATDLRALPTHTPRYNNPTPDPNADPFDYLQYSFLPIGTPLFIAHSTQDGKWHYVECPIAGGWVDSRDVAVITPEFRSEWQTGKYAALIRENVNLPGTGPTGGDSKGGIGTLLPIVGEKHGSFAVLVPVKEKGGNAGTAEILVPLASAAIQPMAMTAGNVALVGNAMMGQPYGWGGMLGLRDCSAMLRDLFTPFGIWLPRNSRAQSRRGSIISLEGMTPEEKELTVISKGVPFLSLVGLPGHISLYIGKWKNQAAIFHNAWGVRIVKDGNDNERFVIGKAVITSLRPGFELENLYRPITFIDRIRTLTTTRNEN